MPFSRDLPGLGINPMSLRSPVLAGGLFTTRAAWEAPCLGVRKSAFRASRVPYLRICIQQICTLLDSLVSVCH